MSSGEGAGEAPQGTPKEGDVLAGKYRVERVLGVGGMGVVVAAEHIQLGERVALKFLLPDALANTDAVARFKREARAAVRIKSEHIARVSDVGELDNGAPYMVMEYLEGEDLSNRIANSGPLLVEHAVEFVLQASEAIAEAHALGIIHRDLKPANIFLTKRRDGSPIAKVLDFGISKLVDRPGSNSKAQAALTSTSAVMGSPLYMSPEQLRSTKDVDERADIWALGAILYELVTGIPPFNGDSLPQLCMQIMVEPPPPLATYLPDAPPGFEAAILQALEKSPKARYQNVGELAAAIVPFGPSRGEIYAERISRLVGGESRMRSSGAGSAPPPPPSPNEGHSARARTAAELGKTEQAWSPADSKTKLVVAETKPRSKLPLVVGAGGAVLVAGLVGARLFMGPATPPASALSQAAIAESAAAATVAAPAVSAPAAAATSVAVVSPGATVPAPAASVDPTEPDAGVVQSKKITGAKAPPTTVAVAAPAAPPIPHPPSPPAAVAAPPKQSPLDVNIK